MEFNFDVNALFPQRITRTAGGRLSLDNENKRDVLERQFAAVVDAMGEASARAQDLRAPITTLQKLQSSKQVLYTMKESSGTGAVVGIIKVGRKRLFLNDLSGQHHEVVPVCVLDFYVHESRQRCGYGRELFQAMLQAEGVKAFEVAIDRPSTKFVNFLRKHYSLESCVPQANNYVVFKEFFDTCKDVGPSKQRLSLHEANTSLSSPFASQLSQQERNAYNHTTELRHHGNTTVKRFTKQLSTTGPEQSVFPFTSPLYSNQRPVEVPPASTSNRRTSGCHSTQLGGGGGGDSEFTWSPAGVSRTHHHSSMALGGGGGGGRQQEDYNIITGRTNPKPHPSHQQSVSKHIKWSRPDATVDSETPPTTHAPFLNMRRAHKAGTSRLQAASSFTAARPGFYSTVSSQSNPGAFDGLQVTSGYSRHSGATAADKLGVHGTSITHQPNTRRKLTFKDRQNSHIT